MTYPMADSAVAAKATAIIESELRCAAEGDGYEPAAVAPEIYREVVKLIGSSVILAEAELELIAIRVADQLAKAYRKGWSDCASVGRRETDSAFHELADDYAQATAKTDAALATQRVATRDGWIARGGSDA